jgi:hypothetical protein
MYFCWAEPEFSGICLAGTQGPAKNVLKFRIVVCELQQRLAVRAVLTDAEQIFRRGVKRRD